MPMNTNDLAAKYDPAPLLALLQSMNNGADPNEPEASGVVPGRPMGTNFTDILGGGQPADPRLAAQATGQPLNTAVIPPDAGGGGDPAAMGAEAAPFNPQMMAMMQSMMPKPRQPIFPAHGAMQPQKPVDLSVNVGARPSLGMILQ